MDSRGAQAPARGSLGRGCPKERGVRVTWSAQRQSAEDATEHDLENFFDEGVQVENLLMEASLEDGLFDHAQDTLGGETHIAGANPAEFLTGLQGAFDPIERLIVEAAELCPRIGNKHDSNNNSVE